MESSVTPRTSRKASNCWNRLEKCDWSALKAIDGGFTQSASNFVSNERLFPNALYGLLTRWMVYNISKGFGQQATLVKKKDGLNLFERHHVTNVWSLKKYLPKQRNGGFKEETAFFFVFFLSKATDREKSASSPRPPSCCRIISSVRFFFTALKNGGRGRRNGAVWKRNSGTEREQKERMFSFDSGEGHGNYGYCAASVNQTPTAGLHVKTETELQKTAAMNRQRKMMEGRLPRRKGKAAGTHTRACSHAAAA